MKFSNGVVEILMVKIPIWDLLVCGVYRPPDTNMNEWKEGLDMITETLNDNQKEKNHNIIISGDMNFADVNWNDINGGIISENNQVNNLQKLMRDNFLTQINNIPTGNDKM